MSFGGIIQCNFYFLRLLFQDQNLPRKGHFERNAAPILGVTLDTMFQVLP